MLILHQFEVSHFNEKARWALAYKQLPHIRESYLPGPHIPAIKKLTGGPTSTPVLQVGTKIDHQIISGSAEIIAWLEQNHPNPSLYPQDKSLHCAAFAIQRHFDEVVGPAVRTLLFSVMINEADYVCGTFGSSKSWGKRTAYRLTYPLAKSLIKKGNAVNPENIVKSLQITRDTLTELEVTIKKTGYLVGDSFSVADLTVASLLAPLTQVDHRDMKRPSPTPKVVEDFFDQWRNHEVIHWVHDIYAKHRPQ